MAGFMAGFGSGFSEAFSTGYKIEKANQANTFEKMYESFEKNRDYVEKAKVNDQKAVAQTKNIMEANGLPPQAFMEVYKRVKQDPQSTEEWAKKVKVTPMGEVKPAEPLPGNTSADTQAVAEAAQPAPAPVEQQTQDAFAPQPSPIGGKFGELINAGNKNVYEGQIERMMQVTGRSREDVIAILNNAVEVPLDPEVAQMQAQYGENPQLKIEQLAQAGQLQQGEGDYIEKVLKDQETKAVDYNTAKENVKGVIRNARDMTAIVDSNEAVLTEVVAGGANFVTQARQEIEGLLSMLGGNNQESQRLQQISVAQEQARQRAAGGDLAGAIATQEQAIASMPVMQNLDKLSQDKTLFLMKQQLLAYKLSALYGQDGRNLSESERKVFESIASAGNSKEKFKQNMAFLLSGEIQNAEGTFGAPLQKDSQLRIQGYEKLYGKPFPVDITQQSIQDTINADPELGGFLQDLMKFNTYNQPAQEQAPAATEGGVPTSETPDMSQYRAVGTTNKGFTIYEDANGNRVVGQ